MQLRSGQVPLITMLSRRSCSRHREVWCLSIPNCVEERFAGPGEYPTNRLIGGGKEEDLSAPKGAHLLNKPAGNRSREGGHPQG